ncbi:PDK repeat-containing protein [Owenweeksia hongkongensis DSM 17368]|uniref:PDK repeat-containing protein n=1 Tax=Owenweeksia hongkongensis (strain DSM 17368 / CIP 108786 / JCM 12287 / NRRL B-23963 / UST20020801) TaxID=926562 RepID=G8R8T8_OWEHD|nr:PKD domain-containing protein [Owenweeksia hongkongensis]AEV32518.1 PDK repeat-containing protein [Owenweeksia hongkongensis DSM 17368]
MKKLLFTSIVVLSALLAHGQQALSISGLALDSSNTAIANQPVWINKYSNGSFFTQQLVYSDALGYYNYTTFSQASTTFQVMTNDCNGRFYSNSYLATAIDTSFDDTLRIGCQGLPALNCAPNMVKMASSSGLSLSLRDSNSSNPIPNAMLMRYWTFGDGTFSTTYNNANVSHSYSQAGSYTVCMIKNIVDTLTKMVYCEDTVCNAYTVSNSSPPTFCTAYFEVDTMASGGASLVLYNRSTPLHNNTRYATSYAWDFGDGGTSNQAFPTHTYTGAGSYTICLTITSIDSSQNICTNTYCDTLGVDSAGNVLYKNSGAGFTLNVLNPNALGVDEIKRDNTVEVFPNPTNGNVIIKLAQTPNDKVQWVIINSRGQEVLGGVESSHSRNFNINVDPLSNGVYQLKILDGNAVSSCKLMVF